jgi:hypothetical protein
LYPPFLRGLLSSEKLPPTHTCLLSARDDFYTWLLSCAQVPNRWVLEHFVLLGTDHACRRNSRPGDDFMDCAVFPHVRMKTRQTPERNSASIEVRLRCPASQAAKKPGSAGGRGFEEDKFDYHGDKSTTTSCSIPRAQRS